MTGRAAIRTFTLGLIASGSALAYSAPAQADANNPYIGEVMLFPGNFCPRGWASAQGQLLSISQNTALFSLLGTFYGGNGQTTFALPNLSGRAINSYGSGPGLSSYSVGEEAGAAATTLTVENLAKHDHRAAIQTANVAANSTSANGNALGVSSNNSFVSGTDPAGNMMDRTMVQVGTTGNSTPVTNRPPYLVLLNCIAIEGIFPARN